MTDMYTDVSLVPSPAALGRAESLTASYTPVPSWFPTVDSWTLSSSVRNCGRLAGYWEVNQFVWN